MGLQVGGAVLDKRGTLYSGFFGKTMDGDNGDSSDSYSRFVSRLTLLPVHKPETGRLLHVGGSVNHLFSHGDGPRYRARPESYLVPHLVDTGDLGGDIATTYGIESAWQNGPLSFQGEYFHTLADDQAGNTLSFYGCYVLSSLFLTGETRPYNTSSGTFGTLTPKHKFSFSDRQWGAWEWTLRASYVDLTDDIIQGGEMSVISTGLNCYLSSQNRLMLVLAKADVNKPGTDGDLYFIQTRLQVAF